MVPVYLDLIKKEGGRPVHTGFMPKPAQPTVDAALESLKRYMGNPRALGYVQTPDGMLTLDANGQPVPFTRH